MTELEELYGLAEGLEKKGINVDDIRNQIRQREEKYLNEEAIPVIAQKIEEMLAPVKRDVILVAEYREGFPVSIKMGKKVSDGPVKETERESVEEETPTEESVDEDEKPSEITDEDLPEESEAKHTKGPRKCFKVVLNGNEIQDVDGIGTMAETIRRIGFKRVADLNIMCAKGRFNLVDKNKRTDKGTKGKKTNWQREIEGWYVYANISNTDKMDNLREIAERLGLDMQVVEV